MALTRTRKAVLGLLVAALVLGVAEGVARALYGAPNPPMVAFTPSQEMLVTVRDGLVHRTLQGPVVLEPFPVHKGAKPRVIWLGGSSVHEAFGTDRDEASGQLARMLPAVESINLGAPGVETSHILDLMPQVLDFEPDALVLYVGHNDRGNRVFEAWSDSERRTMAVRGLLRWSKLFESLDLAMHRRTRATEIHVDVNAVREAFEARLSQIVDMARARGVEVLLVTPTSTAWAPSVRWQCPEVMMGRLQLGDPTHLKAMRRLEGLDLEGDCRDLAWARAVVERDLETLDELRDTDPLPMRADRATVEVVRRVAAEHDARLVDANAAFRKVGGGLEPHGFYLDNLHLRPTGHARIAQLVKPVLEEALGLGPVEP